MMRELITNNLKTLGEAIFSGGDMAIITIAAVLLTLILLGLLVWYLTRHAQKMIDSGEIQVLEQDKKESGGAVISMPLSEKKQTQFTKERLIALDIITDDLATKFCGLSEENMQHDAQEDKKGNTEGDEHYLTFLAPIHNVSQVFIRCGDNAMKVLTWFNAFLSIKIEPTPLFTHMQMEITYKDEGAGQFIRPYEETRIFIVKSSKIKVKILKWLLKITDKRKKYLMDSAHFRRSVFATDLTYFDQMVKDADSDWNETKNQVEKIVHDLIPDFKADEKELSAAMIAGAVVSLIHLQVTLLHETDNNPEYYNESILDSIQYLISFVAHTHPEYLDTIRSAIERDGGLKIK